MSPLFPFVRRSPRIMWSCSIRYRCSPDAAMTGVSEALVQREEIRIHFQRRETSTHPSSVHSRSASNRSRQTVTKLPRSSHKWEKRRLTTSLLPGRRSDSLWRALTVPLATASHYICAVPVSDIDHTSRSIMRTVILDQLECSSVRRTTRRISSGVNGFRITCRAPKSVATSSRFPSPAAPVMAMI